MSQGTTEAKYVGTTVQASAKASNQLKTWSIPWQRYTPTVHRKQLMSYPSIHRHAGPVDAWCRIDELLLYCAPTSSL